MQVGLRLVDGSLVGARIDDDQNVARADMFAIMEANFGDAAGDLRPNFSIVDRIDTAGKFGKGTDCLRLKTIDSNLDVRRRRRHGACSGFTGVFADDTECQCTARRADNEHEDRQTA